MTDSDHKLALPPGYQLGHYRLLEVLGVGGFGVTYLGEHVSLGHRVAVKEYLPNEFAVRAGTTVHPKSPANREDFEWGLARFVDEARTLTRFRHPNLVRVSDYFEANSTAYIVMDYEDGEPLDKLLDRHGTLTEAQLKRVLLPVADGLRQVHAAGFLHRDVKPPNIFVRRSDETPVLLDFGAARNALGRKSRSMTAVVTPGYSPPEQYETDGEQGPWTDIYALSALCFKAMTGNRPEESIRRSRLLFQDRKDPLPSLEAKGVSGYSSQFLAAVDWGLRVIETERPQSLDEWLAQLGDAPAAISAGRRTGSPTPPEAPVRPVAQERAGIGAKGVLLTGAAAVAVGVTLYFVLAYEVLVGSATAQAGSRFRDCPECPEMVVVPAGSFLMGSPDTEEGRVGNEGPVHRVTIGSSFAVGVYEVTVSEFGRFVDATGHSAGNVCYALQDDVFAHRNGFSWRNPGFGQDGSHPAVCVNWEDAKAYVAWLSRITGERYRLPSEAEWEYAARAGTRTARWWGEGESGQCAHANGADASLGYSWVIGCSDGHSQTAPVGNFRANAWGLHDVLGNAWEWTEDCWNGNYRSAPSDGSAWEYGDCDVHVLRGGSWNEEPRSLRSSVRLWSDTDTIDFTIRIRDSLTGFRVARTLTPLDELWGQPFTVATLPSRATVHLLEHAEAYRPGMVLPPGDYRVEVSALGYETAWRTVRHGGSQPTNQRIALDSSGRPFRDCADCPEMVVVPAGRFRMGDLAGVGDEDERPVREVRIAWDFALGRHEVTVGQFRRFALATGHRTNAEQDPDEGCWTMEIPTRNKWDWTAGRSWRSLEYQIEDDQPVVCVSWRDAQAYVGWLSERAGKPYRLPSESEWEYAARARSEAKYHFGNDEARLCAYGNVADETKLPNGYVWNNKAPCGDDAVYPVHVGSYQANDFGLHDMHGNVWEWVQDCWNGNYQGAPRDGSAWESGDCSRRVLRGGSWNGDPELLRSANRDWHNSGVRSFHGGLRVARTLTP